MVIAQAPAQEAGVTVLKKGGNAIDAAVAVGFALAVTYPYGGNIGGGGFMLIRLADGRSTFIDFRDAAPGKASRDMFLDANGKQTRDSVEGWRSSAVPGTVRGLELAQSKYGHLTWSEDMAPAIELASKGFAVSYAHAEQLKGSRSLSRNAESNRIFQKGGKFYEVGDTLKQPELAATLERISKGGAEEFYEGETAKQFAEEMAKNGGLISLDDLRNYKAVERVPITGQYRNYTIISAPPPSAGGIGIMQMLGMLDGTGYEKTGFGSAATVHYMAEVMRRYYADRSRYLGDPDFFKVPGAGLLDRAYLEKRRSTIDPDHATPSGDVAPGHPAGSESSETTQYDVVDSEGNSVSVTYTLDGGYGNGITVPGLGFLLNNNMDNFTAKVGGSNQYGLVGNEANTIQPGKRPLSAMTPTIVLRDGKLFMVLGAAGGAHITTAVLQAFLNVVDFGMNVQDAVDAPRIHHQWQPDRLTLEQGFSPDTIALLKAKGHQVSFEQGAVPACLEAILIDGGWLQGAPDPRRTGTIGGY